MTLLSYAISYFIPYILIYYIKQEMYTSFRILRLYQLHIIAPHLRYRLKEANTMYLLRSFNIYYIISNKVVLDYKFIYILLSIENTKGMTHLKNDTFRLLLLLNVL